VIKLSNDFNNVYIMVIIRHWIDRGGRWGVGSLAGFIIPVIPL